MVENSRALSPGHPRNRFVSPGIRGTRFRSVRNDTGVHRITVRSNAISGQFFQVFRVFRGRPPFEGIISASIARTGALPCRWFRWKSDRNSGIGTVRKYSDYIPPLWRFVRIEFYIRAVRPARVTRRRENEHRRVNLVNDFLSRLLRGWRTGWILAGYSVDRILTARIKFSDVFRRVWNVITGRGCS